MDWVFSRSAIMKRTHNRLFYLPHAQKRDPLRTADALPVPHAMRIRAADDGPPHRERQRHRPMWLQCSTAASAPAGWPRGQNVASAESSSRDALVVCSCRTRSYVSFNMFHAIYKGLAMARWRESTCFFCFVACAYKDTRGQHTVGFVVCLLAVADARSENANATAEQRKIGCLKRQTQHRYRTHEHTKAKSKTEIFFQIFSQLVECELRLRVRERESEWRQWIWRLFHMI